ncbi:MAG: hypothetical protein A49_21090 [Methyloceanibacter sp.]|nr:MAG: hypothetical protein A49_21090 [Methyloceanibacter sp.]
MIKSIYPQSRRGQPQTSLIEANVAQFESEGDLEKLLIRAGAANSEGRIPIVFLDEFDANGLGWLARFLGPMSDGEFWGPRQKIAFGPCILIFCGGTCSTFEQFASLQVDAAENKLPDFVSRLSGYVDIAPIDSASFRNVVPVVRRALILRSALEHFRLTVDRDELTEANIDANILYGLLTVDSFRHGARSMVGILRMCSPIDGRIELASLPSRLQLRMHVDPEELWVRIYRGQYRAWPGWWVQSRRRVTFAAASEPTSDAPYDQATAFPPGNLDQRVRGPKSP